MDQQPTSTELRIRIAKYRAMARLTTDQETAQRIHDLANELEAKVRSIEDFKDQSSHGPISVD